MTQVSQVSSMQADQLAEVIESLERVRVAAEFRCWVRRELRRVFPHACFLATAGNLYGVGSVPTHRISAEFPLSLIEDLKNHTGAVNDPLVASWFKTGKVKYVSVEGVSDLSDKRHWKKVLASYGIRSMLMHGVMDHKARKFVVFQMANSYSCDSTVAADVMLRLAPQMAVAVRRCLENSPMNRVPAAFGHPTLNLTATELQIVGFLAQGLSNKEIARRRGVSDSTVKTQVSRTGAKVGATRRAEIVAIAMPLLSILPGQDLIDYDDLD